MIVSSAEDRGDKLFGVAGSESALQYSYDPRVIGVASVAMQIQEPFL
jgi:hypothetical protein